MNNFRRNFIAQNALTIGTILSASLIWSGVGEAAEDVAKASLPTNAIITGTVNQTEAGVEAVGAAGKSVSAIAGDIVPETPGLVLKAKSNVSLTLNDAEGKGITFLVKVQDAKKDEYPDAIIALSYPGGWGRTYIRPNPGMYKPAEMEKLKADWLKLPPASEHFYTLELRPGDPGETQLWLDGQLMNILPTPQPFASYRVDLTSGAIVKSLHLEKSPPATSFATVPISDHPRPEGMENAQIKWDPKATLPQGFPKLADNAAGIAINGLGTIPGLGSGELQSLFWNRHSTDNLPEQRMFTVPLDTYSDAYILCAVDDSPDKVNSFTLRVTRYGTNRGDAMADTNVVVPKGNAKNTANAQRVGTVAYGAVDARKNADLWLIKVPVKSGLIQDIIYDDQRKTNNVGTYKYLDVELLDPLRNVNLDDAFPPSMTATNRTYSPKNHVNVNMFDPSTHRETVYGNSPHSAAHVFALVLEKSPATLDVRANLDFQVFYKSDNPAWLAKVGARKAGKYTVQWEFADVDGKVVASSKKDVTLAAGKEETVTIPVDTENGWFATRFQLLDSQGQALLDHRGSFVSLPPDTRQAGFESPFGTWLFWSAHGGDYVIERQGPLLQRAGLRHATLPEIWPESLSSKYGLTGWAVPWSRSRKPTLAEKLADHEVLIEKYTKLWPSIDKMLVWHESGHGDAALPTELWGEAPPAPTEKAEVAWKERMEYVNALGEMVRKKYPKLKMQYGNNGPSIRLIAELLRRKFPRQYIDTIASENVGQTIIPEKPTTDGLQATWYLREIARVLGYPDVPVTAAYEWMNRRDKTLGSKMQADWYMRDALHGLAYGFDTIALGTLYDAGSGYYYSAWGDGGLTERYPYMQPKPAYAALATLTSVVDSAKFQRAVPTGSVSLYAMEFQHPDKARKWIYALWTPRGHRTTTLNFAADAPRTQIDTYGRQTTVNGATVELDVSTGPRYIISETPVSSISGGRSWFPEDVPPTSPIVVDAMDSLENWSIAPDPDTRLERHEGTGQREMMPQRTKGNFELREVTDAEKGKCLELELKPEGEIWKGTHEYAVLKLKDPVAVKGPYSFAGVWVKGNGSWGEVMWELEGAKGKKYLSAGYWQDWPGNNATTFEGWRFLRLALPVGEEWTDQVKITGLAATIPRQTLYLTDMVPTPMKTLRFKEISFF